MKEMIILRALPGAGKSTFAKLLDQCWYGSSVIVSADNYWYEDGEYKFDVSRLHLAHKWAQDEALSYCRMSYSCVIIDNTNTTPKEMEPYEKIAQEYGYKVTYLIVENRHGNNSIHNVPDDTIQKMKTRFQVKL